MAAPFQFEHRIAFQHDAPDALLRAIPAAPGVFALRGEAAHAEPYLTRTADLRRRLRRLLAPPEAVDDQGRPVLSRRLNLRDRVRSIEWTRTGSDFESSLVLYSATRAAFGDSEARRRLRLHPPFFLRMTVEHQYPRVYVTNKLSRHALPSTFGPFPSRAAAERYCDAVLDLFKLRRCYEDLHVHPDHPGCAYGEMNKCLAPCKMACAPEAYAAEAARVLAFFTTRGESLLTEVAQQRAAASDAMDFEQAAALHKQWERVKTAAALADELVQPVSALRAVILQPAAPHADGERAEEAAVFLIENGRIVGPQPLSTLGVRAVREQTAVGSSLFAQPLMLAAVPLHEPPPPEESAAFPKPAPSVSSPPDSALSAHAAESPALPAAATPSTLSPEDRARTVLAQLTTLAAASPAADIAERCDTLTLFRRWYYRPEKQRTGEVFLPNPDTTWPLRRILNGAARVVLGPPAEVSPVEREKAREAAKTLKTKIIHEGREGVERIVPVLPKRPRSRKPLAMPESPS